jgi:NAD(P)H-hydrate epimerase
MLIIASLKSSITSLLIYDARMSLPVSLSCAQARAIDRFAINELGLPSLILMENAGINAAAASMDLLRERTLIDPDDAPVTIFCGTGNNGGDGFVIARHLAAWGLHPSIIVVGSTKNLADDARVNFHCCEKLDLPIRYVGDAAKIEACKPQWAQSLLCIDALLGTGFSGEVREPMAEVIRTLNSLTRPLVVSIDLPSGLNGDTGQPAPDDATVQADRTVTFVAPKQGFAQASAQPYLGEVVIADIGLTDQAVEQALAHLEATK